jgi:hypothetical protein
MEKYFETIGRTMFHMKHKSLKEKRKAVKKALQREHDAGPEAGYLLKLWIEIHARHLRA